MEEADWPDGAEDAEGQPPPLRARIRRYLLERLLGGDWQAGDRLPVEKDLMVQFGASRMTVGGVLRELQAQGYVVRDQGRGTFVAEPRTHFSVLTIADPAEEIRARGDAYRCVVLRKARRNATAKQAHALRIEPGAPITVLKLLHEASERVEVIEDRLVNAAMMPDFETLDFSTLSPFVYLMRRYPFPDSMHTIRAIGADAATARLLSMRRGAPCLELTRTTSVRGRRVTQVKFIYRGDKASINGRVGRLA